MTIRVRTYGAAGAAVMVLHGGPGAAGYMAPVAREIADEFHAIEPLQRGGGTEPLTVARHIDDLDEVVEAYCSGERPALVGHSWGAMLALAYAARHPHKTAALVLVGCGTFDTTSRATMQRIIDERMDESLKAKLAGLSAEIADPDERLAAMGRLIEMIYSFDAEDDGAPVECDERAHEETWADMLLQQRNGVYPAAFAGIGVPVTMLHGAVRPASGRDDPRGPAAADAAVGIRRVGALRALSVAREGCAKEFLRRVARPSRERKTIARRQESDSPSLCFKVATSSFNSIILCSRSTTSLLNFSNSST